MRDIFSRSFFLHKTLVDFSFVLRHPVNIIHFFTTTWNFTNRPFRSWKRANLVSFLYNETKRQARQVDPNRLIRLLLFYPISQEKVCVPNILYQQLFSSYTTHDALQAFFIERFSFSFAVC